MCHQCACMLVHGVKMCVFAAFAVFSFALICCLFVFQGIHSSEKYCAANFMFKTGRHDRTTWKHCDIWLIWFIWLHIVALNVDSFVHLKWNKWPVWIWQNPIGHDSSLLLHAVRLWSNTTFAVSSAMQAHRHGTNIEKIKHIQTSTKVFGIVTNCDIYKRVSWNIQLNALQMGVFTLEIVVQNLEALWEKRRGSSKIKWVHTLNSFLVMKPCSCWTPKHKTFISENLYHVFWVNLGTLYEHSKDYPKHVDCRLQGFDPTQVCNHGSDTRHLFFCDFWTLEQTTPIPGNAKLIHFLVLFLLYSRVSFFWCRWFGWSSIQQADSWTWKWGVFFQSSSVSALKNVCFRTILLSQHRVDLWTPRINL